MIDDMAEIKIISKDLQLRLAKGELDFGDEVVQFFIPVALLFTDYEWLKIIAENTLVKEDEEIVKNFLEMAEALAKVNTANLEAAVDKINGLFK